MVPPHKSYFEWVDDGEGMGRAYIDVVDDGRNVAEDIESDIEEVVGHDNGRHIGDGADSSTIANDTAGSESIVDSRTDRLVAESWACSVDALDGVLEK